MSAKLFGLDAGLVYSTIVGIMVVLLVFGCIGVWRGYRRLDRSAYSIRPLVLVLTMAILGAYLAVAATIFLQLALLAPPWAVAGQIGIVILTIGVCWFMFCLATRRPILPRRRR
jgi:hypothetical protein